MMPTASLFLNLSMTIFPSFSFFAVFFLFSIESRGNVDWMRLTDWLWQHKLLKCLKKNWGFHNFFLLPCLCVCAVDSNEMKKWIFCAFIGRIFISECGSIVGWCLMNHERENLFTSLFLLLPNNFRCSVLIYF